VTFAKQIPDQSEPRGVWHTARSYGPGLALSAAIAAASLGIRVIPGASAVSPMVIAFVIGIGVSGLFGTLPGTAAGNRFAAKTLLRFGVALLGLQLTIHQLAALGVRMLLVVFVVFAATFLATKWIGRLLGVDSKLAELIAAGTSVCGASAIIATNAVTRARDQDVGYAVAAVSLFGTLSMIVYPLLYRVLPLDIHTYGLWAGSSVQEVAQVVAAAFQVDPAAAQVAVPVKLARVALLAPLVLTIGSIRMRRGGDGEEARFRWQQIFPLFMVGFILLVALNSVITIAPHWRGMIAETTAFLLTMSLAAIGLETSLRDLRLQGIRPIALTAAGALFIASLSLVLIHALT